MLGKLIKHETRATSRIFLPLYGALLILTIFTKLVMAIGAPDFFSEMASSNKVAEIILGISFTLYFILIVGISVMTLVMIIQRFYKNLFTDEGYLMFSLPVKTWELVLSKLLVGMIWSAVCTIMIVLTFFIFSLGYFSMMELSQSIRSAYSMFYLQTGMEQVSKRLAAVEITLKDAPKHDDLAKIYERVNRLTEEVKGLVGEFAGAKHTLGLLHQFLLNGGGQR